MSLCHTSSLKLQEKNRSADIALSIFVTRTVQQIEQGKYMYSLPSKNLTPMQWIQVVMDKF